MATLRSDVNNLLETRGTLRRAVARMEKQTPDGEVLDAILAKLTDLSRKQEQPREPEEEELQLEDELESHLERARPIDGDPLRKLPSRIAQVRQKSAKSNVQENRVVPAKKNQAATLR